VFRKTKNSFSKVLDNFCRSLALLWMARGANASAGSLPRVELSRESRTKLNTV